ncbi:hypothetical protein ACFFKH_18715 [Micromonospora marina]|nr:hypothetical protein [Micromonospora marina]
MGVDGKRWSVRVTGEVRHWLRDLRDHDPASYESVRVAVDKLAESQAVLLVAGNKAGNWTRWYRQHIPAAEVAYKAWLDSERERRGES